MQLVSDKWQNQDSKLDSLIIVPILSLNEALLYNSIHIKIHTHTNKQTNKKQEFE